MDGLFIGEKLQAARKLRNVRSTPALAQLVNKPRFGAKVIGSIERNERHAQPHEIEWLSEALDLAPTFFTEEPGAATTQLDRIEERLKEARTEQDRISALIEKQNGLLDRQSKILERLEAAMDRDDETRRALDDSAREWIAAAQEATQAWQDVSPRPARARASRTK